MTLQEARKLYQNSDVEIKAIALKYFTQTELTIATLPVKWYDLNAVDGYYINQDSEVLWTGMGACRPSSKNIFATQKQAESSLAFAQLTQLAAQMNDGWEPDWDNGKNKHSVFAANDDSLYVDCDSLDRKHIVFKTKELATFSLENHRELWKQYWMI